MKTPNEIQSEIDELKAKCDDERRIRVSKAIDELIVGGRITEGSRERWILHAMADESVIDDIKRIPL
jgi:hypothetical protein